jgi:hypothetical protein
MLCFYVHSYLTFLSSTFPLAGRHVFTTRDNRARAMGRSEALREEHADNVDAVCVAAVFPGRRDAHRRQSWQRWTRGSRQFNSA